jgi:DNA-directed RNA polymerase beta subunit
MKLKRNQTLKDYLNTTEIDPETTKAALGHGFDKVDGPMLLASSKKLLNVHMGKDEPTDRDSLEYKELHGISDFIKERLQKNKDALSYRIKRNIDNPKRTRITQIVNQTAFASTLESFFMSDDKSSTPEQVNPLEMISGTQRVTLMGAGGIGSTHAITAEMRQVHPSHLGVIDPVHVPSGERIGVNMHVPIGAIRPSLLRIVKLRSCSQLIQMAVRSRAKSVTMPPSRAP